jgi:YD repeat-containing protein
MRSLVSSAQRALFRYAGWTAFAAAIANVSVQPAAAQAPYGFGGVTAAGLPVSSQSSSGGGIEHYSPFTGALGMSVPLYHVGGRGDGGFDIVWNLQPNWIANRNGGTSSVVAIDPYPSSNIAGTSNAYALGGPGNVYIRTGVTWASCSGSYLPSSTQTTVVFVTGTGAQINLVDTATGGAPANIANPCGGRPTFPWNQNRGTLFQSNDGSAIQFTADSPVYEQSPHTGNGGYGVATVNGLMVFSNGVTYRIDNSTVSWIRDRNGNLITLTYGGPAYAIDWYLYVPALTSVLDSLNYTTTLNYSDSTCNGCLSVSYPGAASGHKVEVATANLSSNTLRSGYTLATIAGLFPDAPGQPNSANYTPTVATAITLADNTQYTFQYNNYGEVARMVLPSGAAIEYDYGDGFNATTDGYESGAGGQVMVYRRLQERREYQAGGTGNNYDLRTHYTVSYPSGQTVDKQQSFFNSSSTVVAQTIHTMSGAPTDALSMTGTSCNNSQEGAEVQTDLGAPNPLVTTNVTYTQTGSSCTSPAFATTKQVTLQDTNPKTVMSTNYTYDPYGNVTEQKDTDWSGALIRDLSTVYQYQSNGAYAAANVNLVRLPSYTTLKDGGGNQIAESVWRYDENTSLQATPGIVGYDNSYSNTVRGNVTSSFQWVSPSGFLPTSYSYDNAGNVISTTDPDQHTLTMSYNDDGSGSYAFPTKVTNGLNQTTGFGYYYGARKVGSVTDPRGFQTTYTYADPFDRVTRITRPNGAQTNIAYVTPTWAITFQDQVSAGDYAIQTQVVYDNFGRLLENRLVLDPNDFIDVAYGYDGFGRRTSAANPTKIYIPNWSNDGLNYVTTTTYDSLNRPVSVSIPNGTPGGTITNAVTNIAYQGYTTTMTDPAGHAKQTATDVFGHVASVIEDYGTSNLTTNYFYDLLGDLTTVMKCSAGLSGPNCPSGQLRSFTYDGLGRMTQATNPESNTFTYSYSSQGGNYLSLQSRTDPRGITTTYSYDSAGRTSRLDYSDGTYAAFAYDASGNLTQSANANVVNNYTSYDGNNRLTGVMCRWGGRLTVLSTDTTWLGN